MKGVVTNFKAIFLTVISAEYCKEIDPPIEDGTLDSLAVLGFLSSKKVFPQIMHNVKQRFSRWTNKVYNPRHINP